MSEVHRILKRQLRRAGCSAEEPPTPEQWARMLESVSAAYADSDTDRYTMERSQELASNEMRELHQAIASEHARLDSLLGALSEAVLQVDRQGVIRWTNPAARQLLSRSTLVGRRFDEMVPLCRDDVQGQPLTFSRLLEGEARRVHDAALDLAPSVPVEVSISPLEGEAGLVIGLSDLTEIMTARADLWQARRETEAARMAERAKSMFLANMSHELRTPLNAIIGYSELLGEDLAESGEPGWISDLGRIETAGRHLLALINDILDLSKIEAGRIELFREEVALHPWAEEVVAQVAPLVGKNGNKLELDLPNEPIAGWVDQVRLRQCALNLLSNAAKFTHEGTITFRIRQGERLRVEVEDTGIGMTDLQLEAVFDEFTQAEATTTRKYGGTGLGLTLTRRLMELMGGEVQAQSTPGKGSCFALVLSAVAPSKTASTRTFTPEPAAANGITVLVVDDDPAVHDLFGRHLCREGYTVVTAGAGPEGMAIAATLQPDVITLDVMMPEVDGWTVLAQLRADEATRDIPVVLVTMVEERQRGFSLGANGYLSKPVSGRQLVDTLERCGLAPSRANRVLVVDDDPVIRRLLHATLQRAGYLVSEAGDGLEALARMRADGRPDVVLLDLMMPNLDGFGFLEAQQQDPELRDVPVFVLTAAALDDFERSYLDKRVRQVVAKAEDSPERILEEITRQLGRAARVDSAPAP